MDRSIGIIDGIPGGVRSGQVWEHHDGPVSKRFRISSLKPVHNTVRVFGSYLGSGKFIGSNWSVRKLLMGHRRATLIEDAAEVAEFKRPIPPEPPERKRKVTRLVYPMGVTVARANADVSDLARRWSERHPDRTALARAIGDELGFSRYLVEGILGGITAIARRAHPPMPAARGAA